MSFNACESTFWLFSDQFITVSFLNLLLLIALAIHFFHHLDITSVVYKLYTTKIKTGSYINPVVIKCLYMLYVEHATITHCTWVIPAIFLIWLRRYLLTTPAIPIIESILIHLKQNLKFYFYQNTPSFDKFQSCNHVLALNRNNILY